MLGNVQENNITEKTKEVAKNLLAELKISELTNENIGLLQNELNLCVASLVSAKEDGETIDGNLLEAYDMLTDIVLDNEEDLQFLNKLFFN